MNTGIDVEEFKKDCQPDIDAFCSCVKTFKNAVSDLSDKGYSVNLKMEVGKLTQFKVAKRAPGGRWVRLV